MKRKDSLTVGSGRALTALALSMAAAMGAAHAQVVPTDPYNYSRVSSYTYDTVGRVLTEMVEPDNPALCVLTTYAYDGYGNRKTVSTANCAGTVPAAQQIASRSVTSDYAPATMPAVTVSGTAVTLPKGLFPITTTNAQGHVGKFEYDPRFGLAIKQTDANNLVTSWTLDDFGRKTAESRADGTSTIYRYCLIAGRIADVGSNSSGCDAGVPSDAPSDAVSYVHSEPRNTAGAKMGAYVRVYSDRRGRELRSVTESFDGAGQPSTRKAKAIVKDTVYTAQGAKLMETKPYFLASGSSTTTGSEDVGVRWAEYDALGRPVALYNADPNGGAGTKSFDIGGGGTGYGHYGSKTAAKTSYVYEGLTQTLVNDKNQRRVDEKNPLGLLVRITDEAGGQLAHQHDAFGNLIATKDALQNTLSLKYDLRGRKVEMNDPDAGLWKYDYDVLGQLVWQETPNQRAAGQSTTMTYDLLGRLTSRVEPEGTGSWAYDQSAGCSVKGALCLSSFTRAGTSETRSNVLRYDTLGRVTGSTTTVTNGPTMATANSYDASTGRLSGKTFPSGVKIAYAYTALGYLEQLKLVTPATLNPLPAAPGGAAGASVSLPANGVLWQAKVGNAWSRFEQQSLGNGVNSRAEFEAATGRTVALSAGAGTSNGVLDYGYAWDSLNNLTYRADNIGDGVAGAVTESFEYGDALARLTKYTVAAPAVPNGSRSVTLQYNALGMLLHKSDVGSYAYPAAGSVRPHALQQLTALDTTTTSYSYDANGNFTSASAGKYRGMAYTSFNLPDSQTGVTGASGGGVDGGTAQYTWVYDENHARIKEVRSVSGGSMAGTRTTWYLHPDNAGALGFEVEVNSPQSASAANPAVTSNRHYLMAGGQTVGVLVSTGALPAPDASGNPAAIASVTLNKLEYWHKDHLGSLAATSDHSGSVTARYAYDPFGKRRYVNGSYDEFGNIRIDWSAATNAGTDRGFTGHEHLDDIGLIHMNGRLFDPTIGLFRQPDPHIQEPDNLQNYNRYGYCFNNPLTCTDPTGMVANRDNRSMFYLRGSDPKSGLLSDTPSGAREPPRGGDVGRGQEARDRATVGDSVSGDGVRLGSVSPGSPTLDGSPDTPLFGDLSWLAEVMDAHDYDYIGSSVAGPGGNILRCALRCGPAVAGGTQDSPSLPANPDQRIDQGLSPYPDSSNLDRVYIYGKRAVEAVVTPLSQPLVDYTPLKIYINVAVEYYKFRGIILSTDKANDGQKPAATDPAANRVKPRKGTLKGVTENQPRNENGEMIDPNTGEVLDTSQMDLGHKPGEEWWRRQAEHRKNGATRQEILEAENNSSIYQWEDRSSNRGRRHEKKP